MTYRIKEIFLHLSYVMDSHFGQVRPEIGVGQMEEEGSEVLVRSGRY